MPFSKRVSFKTPACRDAGLAQRRLGATQTWRNAVIGDIPAMSNCNCPGLMALRAALVSSVASAFLVGLAQPADAATFRARAVAAVKKPNPEKDGFGEATKGVLQIVVSI